MLAPKEQRCIRGDCSARSYFQGNMVSTVQLQEILTVQIVKILCTPGENRSCYHLPLYYSINLKQSRNIKFKEVFKYVI